MHLIPKQPGRVYFTNVVVTMGAVKRTVKRVKTVASIFADLALQAIIAILKNSSTHIMVGTNISEIDRSCRF